MIDIVDFKPPIVGRRGMGHLAERQDGMNEQWNRGKYEISEKNECFLDYCCKSGMFSRLYHDPPVKYILS